MPVSLNNRVTLKNGQVMGYAEVGDPQGTPVIHLHGLPSSRYEGTNPNHIKTAEQLHIRMILPDRPGIGLSEFQPYTLASYPNLLADFADQLGLERFPVVGYSSGGKFVVSCAWKISARLKQAIVVAGSAPFDLPGVKEALSKSDRQVYGMAVKLPWVFKIMLGKIARDTKKDPASVMSLFTDISEADRITMKDPEVLETLGRMVNGAFEQGTRGAAYEWKMEALAWGFRLSEIQMPVQIWHGETDLIVSVEHARILANQIPGSVLKIVPEAGHTIFVHHYEELMRAAIR